ncbi:globin [Thioalkalivibrio sp. ALR17-21]|uniref:globin n=1 Tax=Thioalkalivibrio sp. ALR17-21 TaxID=1269813 RepID=UPI000462BD6D|nr:globin [Thioalkalivibrio sp. ALR17-21]
MSYSDVQQSYGRCRREGDFAERFYERFLQADPRVAEVFANTDWTRQKRALGQAISAALSYAEGETFMRSTLERMAQVHSRRGSVPIEPALYGLWLNCMVRTASETDPKWTDELASRWYGALSPAIDLFIEHY